MGKVRRRQLLIAAGGLLAAPFARPQAPRLATVGLLYPNASSTPQGTAQDYFSGILKKLGWSVGSDVVLEHASGEGSEARLPALAQELVSKNVDVIWAAGPEAAVAAARATKRIPIAFYGAAYPVESELVESLARPGRNVTGLASVAGAGYAKVLELLRELAPGATRLAWIRVETVHWSVSGKRVRVTEEATFANASKLGFEVASFPVSRREDFDAAFAAILAARAHAVLSDFTALTFRERHRIAEFANRNRLPSVSSPKVFAEAGYLASHGPDRGSMIEYSFTYVDKILRGARPSELPVELPSRYELAVNLKTARLLGLAVPQPILVRADRVIE
jgi:putative ABC transport system substrate-binding protein